MTRSERAIGPQNRRVPGDNGGPHVRLGILWAVVLLVAVSVGPLALAVPMGAAGALAMFELVRARRGTWLVLGEGVVAVLVAVASPVVVSLEAGRAAAYVLLVAVCLYDASVFVVGTGSRNSWEGPAAGVLTLAPFFLVVGSVLQPPFDGDSPWVLGALTAVLVPFGAPLATVLAGSPGRYPGLRRIDSLLLVGPAWMIGCAALRVG